MASSIAARKSVPAAPIALGEQLATILDSLDAAMRERVDDIACCAPSSAGRRRKPCRHVDWLERTMKAHVEESSAPWINATAASLREIAARVADVTHESLAPFGHVSQRRGEERSNGRLSAAHTAVKAANRIVNLLTEPERHPLDPNAAQRANLLSAEEPTLSADQRERRDRIVASYVDHHIQLGLAVGRDQGPIPTRADVAKIARDQADGLRKSARFTALGTIGRWFPPKRRRDLRAELAIEIEALRERDLARMDNTRSGTEQASKISRALGVLVEHPDWNTKKIADEVGCAREYLARHPVFKRAINARSSGRAAFAGGGRLDRHWRRDGTERAIDDEGSDKD